MRRGRSASASVSGERPSREGARRGPPAALAASRWRLAIEWLAMGWEGGRGERRWSLEAVTGRSACASRDSDRGRPPRSRDADRDRARPPGGGVLGREAGLGSMGGRLVRGVDSRKPPAGEAARPPRLEGEGEGEAVGEGGRAPARLEGRLVAEEGEGEGGSERCALGAASEAGKVALAEWASIMAEASVALSAGFFFSGDPAIRIEIPIVNVAGRDSPGFSPYAFCCRVRMVTWLCPA